MFSDGVAPDASRIIADITSNSMQVMPGEGMTVIVNKGLAVCNGCVKLEEQQRTLVLQAADDQDRIDTVVLRLNDNESVRSCDFYVLKGVPESAPKRPELTRNASIWELGLADVFVAANSEVVTTARITDTRLETERCGVLSSVSEIDTEPLFKRFYDDMTEFEADLQEFKDVNEADFIAWVESIKDILDETTAGHLQNEIEALQATTAELTESVEEINTDLGGVSFGIDGEGNYGYFKADGSFNPFKSDKNTPLFGFSLVGKTSTKTGSNAEFTSENMVSGALSITQMMGQTRIGYNGRMGIAGTIFYGFPAKERGTIPTSNGTPVFGILRVAILKRDGSEENVFTIGSTGTTQTHSTSNYMQSTIEVEEDDRIKIYTGVTKIGSLAVTGYGAPFTININCYKR